jgi:hypothetical protein
MSEATSFHPHLAKPSFRQLCVLAHHVYDRLGEEADPGDVLDDLKWVCAAARLDYRGDGIRAAVESVRVARQKGYRLTMSRRSVTFRVTGKAEPKGSIKAFTPKGWTRPILTSTNPKVKGWQQLVAEQAQTVAADGLFMGPVALGVTFQLPRPQSLPKRSPAPHEEARPRQARARVERRAQGRALHRRRAGRAAGRAEVYAAIAAAPCALSPSRRRRRPIRCRPISPNRICFRGGLHGAQA